MKKPSTLTSLLLFGCLWVVLPPTGAAAQERISNEVARQIGALLQEKASRSPAQRKISSSLLLEIKRARLDPTLAGVPELRSRIELDRDGRTLVDVTAEVSDSLLSRIEGLGGVIVNFFERYDGGRYVRNATEWPSEP